MMFSSMLVYEESSRDYVSMPEGASEQQFQFRFLHPRLFASPVQESI